MKFEIRGKNIELTDAMKDYATKRLSKLERYFEEVKEAQVALSVEGDKHKVEVTLFLDGFLIRAEELSDNMYASIDLVEEKLEKQIDKYKTKLYRNHRSVGLKQAFADQIQSDLDLKKESEEQFKIVRTKRFALKPMDEEEAIMQMNLLEHNFFVFLNSRTEEVNVVYKRKQGDYGLIEPFSIPY